MKCINLEERFGVAGTLCDLAVDHDELVLEQAKPRRGFLVDGERV
jgi:hypothetical protein